MQNPYQTAPKKEIKYDRNLQNQYLQQNNPYNAGGYSISNKNDDAALQQYGDQRVGGNINRRIVQNAQLKSQPNSNPYSYRNQEQNQPGISQYNSYGNSRLKTNREEKCREFCFNFLHCCQNCTCELPCCKNPRCCRHPINEIKEYDCSTCAACCASCSCLLCNLCQNREN